MSDTIARLEVTRGTLTEYPLATRAKGGWQNGVTFYPDADVTKIIGEYAPIDPAGGGCVWRLEGGAREFLDHDDDPHGVCVNCHRESEPREQSS